MKWKNILVTFSISAAILTIPSCAVNPVTGKRQLMFMSEAQEVKIGSDYDPQVIATFGEYKNDALLSFIQNKGKEMGLISHRPKLEYHFRILDSPVINAFAVPGGYIYLTRGILAQFNNEAEMLGVLGHEMGHITARHSAARQSEQQLGQLLLIGGMVASEKFRKYGEYAMQGMQLLFLSFSRDDEKESDRLGVEYISKIRYDARKMADFYKVLIKLSAENDNTGVPSFLSTHPDPGDRYNTVNQDAAKWQEKLNYPSWEVNAESYLSMIDGMVYGEDPRQGFVDNNTFYHPELKFKFPFPSGWQLQNSPIQVTMGPSDGKAIMIFTLAQQKSLDEAAQTTLQQLELNILDSKKVTVNGMPAIATLSNQSSQDQSGQQQSIKVISYFIDDKGTIYIFHGVSNEAEFNNYSSLFESTMTKFDKLSDPSKLNVQAKRIRVKKIQRNGTLADAFRDLGIPQQKLDEMAFLNNMELTDQVTAGKLIKTVGN